MPYKINTCGIYKLVNTVTGQCYVGQSQRVEKRIKEHFRLLRGGRHTNQHLQKSFIKYGANSFYGAIEVVCDSVDELDALEEAFIHGDAWFAEPSTYNIADFAKDPMRGKKHSKETVEKIKLGRNATSFDYTNAEYRASLRKAQMARFFAAPKFVANLKFILDNAEMSYAERARRLGRDTSSTRRLALKYRHLTGVL